MRARLLLLCAMPYAACGGGDNNNGDGGPDGTTTDALGGDADSGPQLDYGDSVLQRNHHANRDALYVQPALSPTGLTTLKLDTAFDETAVGHVYAQVLYVDNVALGKGTTNWVIATTESNQVIAMDATTGVMVWQRTIGPSAASTGAGCGNVSPIGITGTGVIDAVSRTLFIDAAIGTQANGSGTIKTHEIHALDIDNKGAERPGFPIDASKATYQSLTFDPPLQNERGALAFVNGSVYVPYGGHAGDCGHYHGWVLGVPYPAGSPLTAFATTVTNQQYAAGIWAPGGLASDGTNIYAATGNTTTGGTTWEGSEAILRFQPGPVFSDQPVDYFAPHDWLPLDTGDIDIGGSGPVLLTATNSTPANLVVALGKNGDIYLLNQSNFGGIADAQAGDGLFNLHIASGEIINAAAWATTSAGNTWLIVHGYMGATGVGCKTGGGDLIAVKISGSPPKAVVEWCTDSATQGEPMITTTDANGTNATVWFVGSNLNGWDIESGKQVYTGADTVSNVRLFTSPIAAGGRIYIGADGKVYSFKP
jgi:hypothetical protein